MISPLSYSLALAQATPATVVVQQKPDWQLWIEAASAIANIVIAVALLLIGFGVIFAALKVKQLIRKVDEHAQKARVDLAPAIRNVTAVSENLSFMSRTVRKDVESLSDSVTAAGRRLQRAAETAEHRVGEFNALIGVVQEEAESLFVTTASTARGLRAGADAFRRFQTDRALGRGRREDDPVVGEAEDDRLDHEVGDRELEIRIARAEARDIDPDRVF
ncbi:MAG TPA: DUF948 domain-containing protein [Longimicrobium sp.]|nr:DUF948 domain-containing protein [Longimicrobium sp.]